MKMNRSKKGFTLVEILIVVVILGILAAIVIPQFSQASSEARNSSVKSNLQMVRSQIELYKIQHNEALPGLVTGVNLIDALTTETTSAGVAVVTAGTGYGPYMQKFPDNSVLELGNVIAEINVAGTTPSAASTVDGWAYNTATGEFIALNSLAITEDW